MAVKITWSPETGDQKTITIGDGAVAALELYRLAQTKLVPRTYSGTDGRTITTQEPAPIYADLLELVVATIMESLVKRAFAAYQPEEITEAKRALDAARAAYEAAQSGVFAGAIGVQVEPVAGNP